MRHRLLIVGSLGALVAGLFVGRVAHAQDAALSENEGLRAQLLQVRTAYAQLLSQHDACRAELGAAYDVIGRLRAPVVSKELTEAEAALKADIEKAHEGYTWNAKTGALEKSKGDR